MLTRIFYLKKRNKKGIWQNLYQFPLVESKKSLTINEFHLLNLEHTVLESSKFNYSLYNEIDKVHKLSHQHLHTKFWIVEVDLLPNTAIPINNINKYPTSVLISNFINEFNF